MVVYSKKKYATQLDLQLCSHVYKTNLLPSVLSTSARGSIARSGKQLQICRTRPTMIDHLFHGIACSKYSYQLIGRAVWSWAFAETLDGFQFPKCVQSPHRPLCYCITHKKQRCNWLSDVFRSNDTLEALMAENSNSFIDWRAILG